jgi:hypothetical protein
MNGSKRILLGLSSLALPWLLAGSAAVGADDDDARFDRRPRDCVQTQAISRTEILDDQTIIFFMRGKNVAYRNFLPRKCPGLKRRERFGYQVTAGRLCNIDMITVLERAGNVFDRSNLGGFQPGFTCRLGDFLPMSREDLESLKAEKAGDASQSAVKTKAVTLPPAPRDGDAPAPASAQAPAPEKE